MKKMALAYLLCMLQLVMLCGCGQGDLGDRETATEEQNLFSGEEGVALDEQSGAIQEMFSWEQLPEEEAWRDNTLDDYTASVHLPLIPARPEGELGGGREYVLGSSCGAVLKKHVLGSVEESWDELKMITDQGEENSVRLAFVEEGVNQAWGIGSIVGSDHFMMLDCETPGSAEGGGWRYRFLEIDEKQQAVRIIPMDFLADSGQEAPQQIMVDKSGNIHFTTGYLGSNPESVADQRRNYYMIADSEGRLLVKKDYTDIAMELVALYDGRVALCTQLVDNEGKRTGSRLEWVEAETGETMLLAEFGKDAPKAFQGQSYYTLWDEKTLLYADNRGLHFADLFGKDTGDVYIWSNHGVRFSEVAQIQLQEDGQINLIYYDYDNEGNLLCLNPTQEKMEIQKIVFAVSPAMRNVYNPSVVEFNKKYPAYHIELKTDYEETALLTELIAGKGPVLIDTQLTGFESHKKLWTSLEGLFAGEEWEDALIPKVMELGRIDNTLYGIVSSFELETVVIAENEPTDWDYESFLDGMEHSSIEAAYNGQNTTWSFLSDFLIHGLEDNYLLDAQSGDTYFDSDGFRRALRLGATYCNEEDWIEPGTPLLEGKVFCNIIRIPRPELIDLYRICYGEDANYIGFPSQDGSAHYIDSNAPLTVRATASDEEKKVAGTFLRMLLSQEGQLESTRDSNFWLSVRRDVLEEQICQVNERSRPVIYGFSQIVLGDDYDREYDARLLEELLESARPKKYFPRELNAILMEELEEYAAGVITEEVLIERLTRRVELYLAEQG